jgi:ubiquinone/menaquinone biosynthesis C-methylase UbiE
MHFYSGLSATLYDSFFFEIDKEELSFYEHYIKQSQEPVLEIACGTGRILIPLLKRGYDIEGFDSSSHMLQLCKDKAKKNNVQPILYQQEMQSLQLPKTYGCMFSPLGSYQQIADRKDAQQALQKFYEYLMLDGMLIIYLYLPWYNTPTFGQWYQHESIKKDGKKIIVYEKLIHDPIEQLIFAQYRYEVWQDDICIAKEEKEMTIRWYSRFEFQMMLEQSGFKNIQVAAGYQDNGPFDQMMFIAQK